MSWRDNFRATTELVSRSNAHLGRERMYDSELIINQIGDRDVVVDACLPPQLADDLRKRDINAIWVPAVLGDGVSDEEIERLLLIGEGLLWESRRKEKVLLTRDVKFCRKLHSRGILVKYQNSNSGKQMTAEELKKEVKFLRSHPVSLSGIDTLNC